MADLKKAIEAVKLQARTFQSVILLAEALEDITSVEQVKRELDIKIHKLAQDHDKLVQENLTLHLGIEEQHRKAKQIVDDAEHAAKMTRDVADAYRESMMKEADEILSSARIKATQTDIESKQLRDEAWQSVDQARKELVAIETRIQKAKDRMATMLGA